MQQGMKLPLDTVANSFIENNMFPGQLGSRNPFQFLGLRPACTTEEVEKKAKTLRYKFHPDKMDDQLDMHLAQHFKISFSDEDWATHESTS